MRIHRMLAIGLAALCCAGAAHSSQGFARPTAGEIEEKPGYVVAGPGGAEWVLPGGAVVRAQAGAELSVIGKPQHLQLQPGRKRAVYSVLLRSGRVDVEIAPDAKSAIVLGAPRKLSAIVPNGSISVSAQEHQVALANYEGGTIFSTGEPKYLPVPAGTIKVISRAGVSDAMVIDGPTDLAVQRVFMTLGKPVDLEHLSWKAREGAASYRLELVRHGDRLPLHTFRTTQAQLPAPVAGLAPGRYHVAVKAVDDFGIDSRSSLESTVHVVDAKLPQGAYFDGAGRIRMVPGSRVQLAHVDGLEMTYSKVSYIPALESVGINRYEPATIFLRAKDATEHYPLRFAPRSVRARIALSPGRATWPDHQVDIAINLEDPSGQPVPAWIEMKPKVMVGLDPIDVQFTRSGNTLRAKVPPQAGAGPWVVRVEVQDQFGLPLGRDFIEIVASQAKPKRLVPGARVELAKK